jgi:sensor histidine kinase regulating citrate/malate metabolism
MPRLSRLSTLSKLPTQISKTNIIPILLQSIRNATESEVIVKSEKHINLSIEDLQKHTEEYFTIYNFFDIKVKPVKGSISQE